MMIKVVYFPCGVGRLGGVGPAVHCLHVAVYGSGRLETDLLRFEAKPEARIGEAAALCVRSLSRAAGVLLHRCLRFCLVCLYTRF